MPIITKQPEWTNELSDKNFSNTIKIQLIIWSNIYHWRRYRGLSQSELATKAGITQSIVSELEGGDYNPSIEMLSKIANTLSIKIEDITKENFNRRFFETLDYFISKIENIDILKLMKLVYFADFEYKQKNWQKFTWMEYMRRHAWPFTNKIYLADKFFLKNWDKFENRANLSKKVALSRDDERFLDEIIKEYGSLSSTDIRDKSYETEPMKWCKRTNHYKMWKTIL